jgi:hypothetical protein
MKKAPKYFLIAALSASLFTIGCSDADRKAADDAKHKYEAEKNSKDSIEKVFVQTLWEIDRNLQVIQEKQGTIVLGPNSTEEKGISGKERILRNIQVINTLVEDNKQKIASLEEQVKKYKYSNAQVLKLISDAQNKMKLQEQSIAELKNTIALRDSTIAQNQFDISTLQIKMNETEMKSQMLEELSIRYDKDLNTAYYTTGSYAQLKKEGVLQPTSGIGTIVKKEKLNLKAPANVYTEIDIREVDSIPINAKKVKLLTYHPSGSYELKKENGQVAWLAITDPAEFWKVSKYMVLETK